MSRFLLLIAQGSCLEASRQAFMAMAAELQTITGLTPRPALFSFGTLELPLAIDTAVAEGGA